MRGRRVGFETLGCKLNQYETDAMAAAFQALGWEVVDGSEDADAYVINTCTVTNKADRKSRNTLNRYTDRGAHPTVVVTGCFAESARETLEGRDGVTFVVPNARKNQIPSLVDAHARGEVLAPSLPAPDPFGYPVHGKVFHTRASLKIQDGCDNFCTFCIIPSVRGRALSRPRAEILAVAAQMLQNGRKELVLTGVNLGRWQGEGCDFTDLVADLLELPGDYRLRITSLEPEGLGPRFAALLRHPKMAPHLHLCLQSASPRILLAMRREYQWEQYRDLVALLRSVQPQLNLTTDLIVGFPGETDDDFQRSLASIHDLDFGHVHVFPYSRRRDTRAERMPDQVPEAVKAARSQRAQERAREQRSVVMERLLGQQRVVLVETPNNGRRESGWLRGLSEDYFPVRWRGKADWNSLVPVRLTRVDRDGDELTFEAEAV